jgi:hypothetical protein
MQKTSALVVAAGILLLSSACSSDNGGSSNAPEPVQTARSGEEAARRQQTIVGWIECDECNERQLEAVAALGAQAVPTLSAMLRDGPPADTRSKLRDHLVSTYRDQLEYAKTHPEDRPTMTEEETVQLYMQNQLALYQTRAARALGAIGGAEARAALNEALKQPLSDDAKAAVNESLQKIKDK